MGQKQQKDLPDQAKLSADLYRQALAAALAREVSRLREVYGLKKQITQLTDGNVLPLRPCTTDVATADSKENASTNGGVERASLAEESIFVLFKTSMEDIMATRPA